MSLKPKPDTGRHEMNVDMLSRDSLIPNTVQFHGVSSGVSQNLYLETETLNLKHSPLTLHDINLNPKPQTLNPEP